MSDWGQDGVDTDVPNVARMYDYYLGGLHNFPADREMAQRVIGAYPSLPEIAKTNREFLRRVVNHLVSIGVDQFLDLGSGLPTVGNVHEVAQAANPEAKVVYVDFDATATMHSRLILIGNPNCTVVQADYRQPEVILNHRDARFLLDFGKPIAVLALGVVHFIPDNEQARSITETIYDYVAPGSYFVISHASRDQKPDEAERVEALYARTGNAMNFRTREEIVDSLGRFSLVPPGLVPIGSWQPDDVMWPVERYNGYTGIAIK